MTAPRILAQPIGVGTFTTTPKMRELVNRVLDSERISYGPMSRELEQRFAALHGCDYGVLSNSGTSSLQVALQAMKEIHGWKDGDEVIVPAVTFVATANIVLHNRMKPVLVDVDPIHYGINPGEIEHAITSRTRAVIPVHLFGQPCDMVGVDGVLNGRLGVIEDSCECMFVRQKTLCDDGEMHYKQVGSLGDIGCFSFYVAHLLTAGVGGIGITQSPIYAQKMRSLVNHGRDGIYISIDDDKDTETEKKQEIISRRFRFESIGHSFRITELESAIALAQLDDWEQMVAARQYNAYRLTEGLKQWEHRLQLPSERPGSGHAYMMYPVVLRDEPKIGLVTYLEERGIETRDMLPLTNQPVYRGMFNEDDYPVAKWINESGFYVASHQDLTEDEIDRIIETFSAWFQTR